MKLIIHHDRETRHVENINEVEVFVDGKRIVLIGEQDDFVTVFVDEADKVDISDKSVDRGG